MSLLKSAGDVEFVKHNVEDRLGRNLKNKKLWKLYLKYLAKVDPREMLQVYSKYCRFFLDDVEMVDEYEAQVQRYGPVEVPWKNLFHFESATISLLEEDEEPENETNEWLLPVNFELTSGFSKTLIPKRQRWSLPLPIMQYLLDNPRPFIFGKLQQTCKYFFNKNSTLFCRRYLFDGDENPKPPKFVGHSVQVSSLDSIPEATKRLYITTSLKVRDEDSDTTLSHLLNNYFYRCDARFIDIGHQLLTETEYQLLVGHGKVEKLVLHHTDIVKNDGVFMILEEVLEALPNVKSIK